MYIKLRKEMIIKWLVSIAVILIVIHSAILVIYYSIGDPKKFDFVPMFDLDMEQNIPTYFSSLLFVLNAFAFYFLGLSAPSKQHQKGVYWKGLSIIFIFLSIDESIKIHETLGVLIARYLHASELLYYPWVIPYIFFVILLGILYMRFFMAMERKILYRFVYAAALFLVGAIGFDMLGGAEASRHGTNTIYYSLLYTIEESLEMFGLIYLFSILLHLIKERKILLQID